jgi:hypothetical protein
VPPFGPPHHPSFPSGHSFLGHFIGLLLLEIPEIAKTFGEIVPPLPPGPPVPAPAPGTPPPTRGQAALKNVMNTAIVFNGPLLWLGNRLGKNRERAGLHYPSDSSASRWLAGALWALLTTTVIVPAGTDPTTVKVPAAKPPNSTTDVFVPDLINCPSLQRVLLLAKAEWAS